MTEIQKDQTEVEAIILSTVEKKPQGKKRMLVLLGLLTLLVGSGIGFTLGRLSAPVRHLEASKDFDVENSQFDQLVTSTVEADFHWKFSDLFQLNFQTIDQEGDRPEDVVFDYGQAEGMTLFYGRLGLLWRKSKEGGDVQLEFQKVDGDYRLIEFSSQYLPEGDWKKEKAKVKNGFARGFTIGDGKTGKGGISYKQVLEEFKNLQGLMVSSDPYGDHIEMQLIYDQEDGKRVTLTFVRQEDGDYLLAKMGER